MDPIMIAYYFLIIIPSSIIHEYAHGWMADQLGDPTARYAGRLTINPLPHIDLWGTILLPLFLLFSSGGRFMFAYAKPVPYNPYNLKDQKWGPALVGIAGPLANLLLASVFAILVRFFAGAGGHAGSVMAEFFSVIVYANVLLMVFNLVPIPPLDGSKVLYALMPDSWHSVRVFLDRFGFFILLIFVFFLFQVLDPVINFVFNLLVGQNVLNLLF